MGRVLAQSACCRADVSVLLPGVGTGFACRWARSAPVATIVMSEITASRSSRSAEALRSCTRNRLVSVSVLSVSRTQQLYRLSVCETPDACQMLRAIDQPHWCTPPSALSPLQACSTATMRVEGRRSAALAWSTHCEAGEAHDHRWGCESPLQVAQASRGAVTRQRRNGWLPKPVPRTAHGVE